MFCQQSSTDLDIHGDSWGINNVDFIVLGSRCLALGSMRNSAFACTQAMVQLLSSANCHTVTKHGAPYLKLLWEVKGNGVVLLSCFEVSAGLHKCDDWSGHADLCIVHIVARDVLE